MLLWVLACVNTKVNQEDTGATKGAQLTLAASGCGIEPYEFLEVDGLGDIVDKLAPSGTAATRASAIEFVLEGLHLNQLLNKDRVGGRTTYMG